MTILELPPGYHLDEYGLLQADGRVIANFFLLPQTAYRCEGNTLPSFCDVSVVRDGKLIPFQSRLDLTGLTPAWWKCPPPGCYFAPGARAPHRHMERLFQTLLGRVEPVTIFRPASLGWEILPTGEHIYVTGSGAIGAEGYFPENRVWIPSEMSRFRLETLSSASKDDMAQYFWNLYRAIPGVTDILLANSFAAILFPCFKAAGVESRFPIILEGPSEAKKTTLACLTSCLYNRKDDLRGNVTTLTSTNRALERRGIEFRHTVMVFDDLFPDGGSALEQKALVLIRDIANQIPRQSCSGKSLDGALMECGAVITAEEFPNCGRSTRTRCLRLPLRESVPNGLILPLQERPELLGNVFQAFIMRTAGNLEGVTQQIEEDFHEYRKNRSQPGTSPANSERLYEIGFVLYTALQVYFSQEYGPDSSIVGEELSRFQNRLNACIAWQLSPQAAPGRGWLISATAGLYRKFPKEFFYRSGYICIPPRHLCGLLQQFCHDRTISESDIIRQLRSEQLLSTDKSGASTKKIKGLGRCLCIDKQRLLR